MKEQKLKVEYVPIKSLKPYAGNAKEHPDWQIEQIMLSIKEFGFQDPIGIWKNEIVEGHGRLIAAKELGMDTVPVIRLDQLTDEQRRAYALVHNKLTMNTDFDWSKLEEELAALHGVDMSQYGFEDLEKELEDLNIQEDDFEPDFPEEPKAKRGDVYQLGDHRLMCGDSTIEADLLKLMGGGTGRHGLYRSALWRSNRRQKSSTKQRPEGWTLHDKHRRRHAATGATV